MKKRVQLRIGDEHIRWFMVENSRVSVESVLDGYNSWSHLPHDNDTTVVGYKVVLYVTMYSGKTYSYSVSDDFVIDPSVVSRTREKLELENKKKFDTTWEKYNKYKEEILNSFEYNHKNFKTLLNSFTNDFRFYLDRSSDYFFLLQRLEDSINRDELRIDMERLFSNIEMSLSSKNYVSQHDVYSKLYSELEQEKKKALREKEELLIRIDKLENTEKFIDSDIYKDIQNDSFDNDNLDYLMDDF